MPGSADWLAGLHDGTDFGADYGTPVYAAHAGVLSNRLDPGGYGQYVQIDADGIATQYGHVRDMWIIPDGTWVEPAPGSPASAPKACPPAPTCTSGSTSTDRQPTPCRGCKTPNGTPASPPHRPKPPHTCPVQAQVEGHVVRWLLDHTGLDTRAGVAGVCGNIQQESSFPDHHRRRPGVRPGSTAPAPAPPNSPDTGCAVVVRPALVRYGTARLV